MEWIIINIVESFLLSWFMISLVDAKKNQWLYYMVMVVSNFTVITFSNHWNMYDIFLTTLVIIINVFIAYFFTNNTLLELCLIMCIETVYSCVISCFAIFIATFLKNVDVSILKQVLYALVFAGIYRYVKKERIYLPREITIILILILYFMHFVLQHFLQLYLVIKAEVPEIMITFIMLILCILALGLLFAKVFQLNIDHEDYLRLKKEEENEKSLSYLYEQLKIEKHDLRHDFDLLNNYREKQEYSKIMDYIKEKYKLITNLPTLINSKNSLINTVINSKIIQAYTKHINVISYISVKENVYINDYDLNALLSNILDNAIENCIDEGNIDINIIQDDMFLHMKISNSIDINHFSKDLVTRKDKRNHGFGLKSMKRITDKYGGNMEFKQFDNTFEITITLFIKK